MPIESLLAGRRQSHLPRSMGFALVALASTALTQARAAEFAPAIDLYDLDGTTGFRLNGVDDADRSGWSVASAGDINGDGFGDIVISAFFASNIGGSRVGESYVVFGKAAGFASAIDLGHLNGITGFRLDGIDDYDFSGLSVASAGDVNGDGFGDILIGAPAAEEGVGVEYGEPAGESYVVFGKATGFAAATHLGSLKDRRIPVQ